MAFRVDAMGGSRRAVTLGLVMLMAFPSFLYIVQTGGVTLAEPGLDGSPPARNWLDIAVDGIDVQKPSESNNIYPGQTIFIWIKLVHDDNPLPSETPIRSALGNAFTCVLVIDDTFNNVTTMYKQVTDMDTNYTGKDPPHTQPGNPPYVVVFKWTVPLRKPAGISDWSDFSFMMYATITIDDDDKSDNYRSGSGLKISEPEFAPLVWEEGTKDNRGPIHDVIVGQSYFIPFLLMNEGPALDYIGVQIMSSPEGWNTDSFSPRVVYPNDLEELELPVQVPNNPFLALNTETGKEKIYTIEVRAFSAFYPNGPYLMDEKHTFRFKVAFKPGVEIWPVVVNNYLVPGEDPSKNTVEFYIKNTGNGESTYTLSTNLQDVDKKRGWDVTFKSGDAQQEDLQPNKVSIVTLKVRVPENAGWLTNINLVIRATLTASAVTFEKFSDPMIVYADKKYAADIQNFEGASFLVEPGKENFIRFNFTNQGNTKDDTMSLNVTYKPYDWTVVIDQTPLKGKGIGPLTTIPIMMTVIVPETSSVTAGTFRPKIVVEARSRGTVRTLDKEEFFFMVPLRRKLELTSPQPAREGFLGGKIIFDVNVRNAGNEVDTFNLSVNHPWAELDQELVLMSPNEVITIKVYIDIPQNAAADTNPDTPFPLDPDKNWYDGYKITVSGYSLNETKKGSTLAKVDLILHVQPFYNFEMEIDPAEKPLRFSMDHDQSRTVRVKLTNLGNIALNVKLSFVDNPNPWLRSQQNVIEVPFGRSSYASLYMDPAAGEVSKELVIVEFKGTARAGFSVKAGDVSFVLPIRIEFYRLMFSFTELKMNKEVFSGVLTGQRDIKYSFQVNLTNSGTKEFHPAEFEPLFLVLYDGSFEVDRANITYLRTGDFKEVRFSWIASSPGSHPMAIVLEGDVPVSPEGETEVNWIMNIERDPPPPPKPEGIQAWEFLVPLALLIIFATAVFVFVTKYNQIFISPIDTGYDEKGEYRPWAVKEKFKEEAKQLEAKEAPPALPPPSKPELPPAPSKGPLPVVTPAAQAMAPRPVAAPMAMPPPRAQPMPAPQSMAPRPVVIPPMPVAQPMTARPMGAHPVPVQPMPQRPAPPVPVVPRPPQPQAPK